METVKESITNRKIFSFSIDVKKHTHLFGPLFRAINRTTVLPILEDVLVSAENGVISYSATDLENIVTITLPLVEKRNFTFMFPGIELRYLLRCSLSAFLEIDVASNIAEPNIIVKSSGFTLKMWANNVNDYPKSVLIENEISFTINVKEIALNIANALKFVSTDFLRPAMTGVFFTNIDGYINIVATDAHKMYWQRICKAPSGFKERGFLLSAKTAALILMMSKGEKSATIDLTENHIRVKFDGKTIVSRIMDERYPNFMAVIPDKTPLTICLNRKALISSLSLCLPFTNKSTYQVNISVFPNQIKIDGGEVDFGFDFKHHISLSKSNLDTFAPFKFGINAKFLLTALSCSKEELVSINSSMSPLKAIIIDGQVLVMPLILNT